MTTLKRKAQNKAAQANYRARMKAYIACLENRVKELMKELNQYKG